MATYEPQSPEAALSMTAEQERALALGYLAELGIEMPTENEIQRMIEAGRECDLLCARPREVA